MSFNTFKVQTGLATGKVLQVIFCILHKDIFEKVSEILELFYLTSANQHL